MRHAAAVIVIVISFLLAPAVLEANRPDALVIPADAQQPELQIDSEAEIRSVLYNINESVVGSYIQALQDYGTRYCQTPYQWDAASYIYSVMSRHGLSVEYHVFRPSGTYSSYRWRNVVATLPGTNPSSTAIYVICAHYDSISDVKFWNAPGADDNGSGVAGVMAAAETLSHYSFNHTIRFIAFAGEEVGLTGSNAYAKLMSDTGANVSGVINLDMVGYNPDPGNDTLRLRTNVPSEDLANFTVGVGEKYRDVTGLFVKKVIDTTPNSDHASFWTYGYDAIHLIEERYAANPNYHKTTDIIDNLNLTYAANSTQVAIAALAELAEMNLGDMVPPAISHQSPTPNGWGNETPIISFHLTDANGINTTDLCVWANGAPVPYTLSYISLGWAVSTAALGPYVDMAAIQVRVTANDTCGNMLDVTWNFTVDAVPPAPPTNLSIALSAVESEKQGMVLDIGPSGSLDDTHLMRPWVIFHGGEYKMWYVGHDGSNERILYANSSNGVNWTKRGLAIDIGAAGDYDSWRATFCSVVWAGEYKMWYSGDDGSYYRILYANSSDGLTWVKRGLVLDGGAPNETDMIWAYAPSVLLENATYRMWYSAWDGVRQTLMLAESANGLNWTKQGIVLDLGPFHSLDAQRVSEPVVLRTPTGYLMWYTGFDGLRYRVLEASSAEGIKWLRHGICVHSGGSSDLDYYALIPGGLILGNVTSVYYTGGGTVNLHYRIFRATRNLTTPKTDLILRWSQSASADVVGYAVRSSTNWTVVMTGGGTCTIGEINGFAVMDAGDGNATSFYGMVSAIDRAGHRTGHWEMAVKVGTAYQVEWAMLGDPLVPIATGIDALLSTVQWDYALAYDPLALDHWVSNYLNRADVLDDLWVVDECQGLWVRSQPTEVFAAAGIARNRTIALCTGWNLVAMPYVHALSAGEVKNAVGSSCQIVEGLDPTGTYLTGVLGDGDVMLPGQAYWLYMSADTTWTVENY
ncbi:MAG: M20/M25/M40 family metallo-hydrolase [Candidatus Thermoplasmatota archaeon]